MPMNLFLLTHKCGNNYFKNLHRLSSVPSASCEPNEAMPVQSPGKSNAIINVRCRNFGYDDLLDGQLLDSIDTRFFVITRHPASFVLSATKYHHRGSEKWARNMPQAHFGGRPLTQALQEAENAAARQIVTMIHFKYL